ncbi:hypothetical protein QF002_001319 [Paraburkholderia youngii]
MQAFLFLFRWGRVLGPLLILGFWGFTLHQHATELHVSERWAQVQGQMHEGYCAARFGQDQKLFAACIARS